jgi:hypothetical protein
MELYIFNYSAGFNATESTVCCVEFIKTDEKQLK